MPAGTARGPDSSEPGKQPRPRAWGAIAFGLSVSLFTVLWLSLQGLAVVYHDPRAPVDVRPEPSVAADLGLALGIVDGAAGGPLVDGGRDAPPAEPPPADDPVPGPPEPDPPPVLPDVLPPVPSLEHILAAAGRAFPEQPEKAARVAFCELGGYANPNAFYLTTVYGGPMQIHRETWERWFLVNYGWPWHDLVFNLEVHFAAARIILDRAGGVWTLPWPVCGFR